MTEQLAWSEAGREGWSRRDFLAALGLTAAVGAPVSLSAQGPTPPGPDRPRCVIFMVSDGMSAGVLSLAQHHARATLGRDTHWRRLLADPRAAVGLFETSSLDALVTDSAAAASAWGSGSRVANGQINRLPDGRELTPIARVVRDAGYRVGLVTTATVTHATPAGFAAVQDRRQDENHIAPQYRDLVDVILGGGQRFFPQDLLRQYEASGYTLLRRVQDFAAHRQAARLLGLFAPAMMPYSVDHRHKLDGDEGTPTLAQMTELALNSLAAADKGFLLQVEGARVDHAAHASDTPALLGDQLAFDDALAVALDFARKRGDTLVIVTTDHGNSNPGLFGTGKGYLDSEALFAKVAGMKASYQAVMERLMHLPKTATGQDAIALVASLLGVTLKAAQADLLLAVLRDRSAAPALHPHLASPLFLLGQIMADHTAVGWIGNTHTSDPALVTAIGPGAQRFAGVRHHTEAFAILTDLLGCPFRNPSMSALDAQRFPRQPLAWREGWEPASLV